MSRASNMFRDLIGAVLIRVQPKTNSTSKTLNQPLTRPADTLSPSDGERDGVRGSSSRLERSLD